MSIQAPDNPKSEFAAAVIKGGLGAVPLAGGLLVELTNLYLNPVEQRKKEWVKSVGVALEEIQAKLGLLPAALEANEQFVSFLYQATHIAIRNHKDEKLKALKNAIVATADPKLGDADLPFQFLRYVDELGVTHLRILKCMEDHAREISVLEDLAAIRDRASELIRADLEREEFRACMHDLSARNLLSMVDIHDYEEYATGASRLLDEKHQVHPVKVTELGRRFLHFISDH